METNNAVRALEPTAVWGFFADLNAVPRASKKEKAVAKMMRQFGKNLGLEVSTDATGNVLIKKPASEGMQDRATVCLQGHLDMVHQKNADTEFDFDKQGIEMYVEDGWVRAQGTTLGADNGLGVASIMAVLASKTLCHPPIEALFTIDEETGMTGALGLEGGLLEAEYLLNLDTEEDNELTIGCAGGIDVTGEGTYRAEPPVGYQRAYRIEIKGLKGGHSGIDIHRGRANANKLMNRLLYTATKRFAIQLARLEGGSLRNAIPRESFAVVAIPKIREQRFFQFLKDMKAIFVAEYGATDPDLDIVTTVMPSVPTKVMKRLSQLHFLQTIYQLHNGIWRMDSRIDGLVLTSNNVARIKVRDGNYTVQCLTRSAIDSEKMDLAQQLTITLESMKAKVTTSGAYPGWTPDPTAEIVELMINAYKTLNNGEIPLVQACHAGLECGILGTNYPNMQMISFGPTIRGAHSPDEAANIESFQKFWKYLIYTLENIPLAQKKTA